VRFGDALYCKAAAPPLISDAIHNNKWDGATMDQGSTYYPADRRKPPAVTTAERDVDFSRVLKSLGTHGYSLEAISLHANLSRAALRDYLGGTHPLYAHGDRILRLWSETTGNAKDLAPKMSAPRLFGRTV
jgi:hypothetical protein